MKSRAWKLVVLFIILAALTSACNGDEGNTNSPGAPLVNGDVIPTTIQAPDPGETARAYLDAWTNFDYEAMYNLLTTLSRDAIPMETFLNRYQTVTEEGVLTEVRYEILQTLLQPKNAQIGYRVTLVSGLVGEISRETTMNLSLENGDWRVVWDDTLILPELAGGNLLSMESIWPTRGIIYDREGTVLAGTTNAVAVAAIPSNIPENGGGGLLNQIQTLCSVPARYFAADLFDENAPFLLPIAEVSQDLFNTREAILTDNYGDVLSWAGYFTRLTYQCNPGGHALGWYGSIPTEEAEVWRERGYPIDKKIGRMGVEAWGEEFLSGKPSADLSVISPEGAPVTVLASRESEPSQSIYTTLDANLQKWAQLAIRDFNGAVVAIEMDTGRVLAMASSPSFDPNDADLNNPNSEWGTYFDGTYDQPLLNRAVQGQYPPGSIFKLITFSAAVESQLIKTTDSLYCDHYWIGPDGQQYEDWTLEKERPPSGDLTFIEGLMRSCNPWFYQAGLTLYQNNHGDDISEMARAFGLGSPTGIIGLPEGVEASGQIINPDDVQPEPGDTRPANVLAEFHAFQQGIGQSKTLITPLQAAAYVAAIGNGGTLYRPQLIERIENTAGESTYQLEPIVNNTLPISEGTLAAIREGMLLVTENTRGTAYATFDRVNFPWRVYGKTGTAQNPGEDPHAWFIGYTNFGNEDLPDIAIAVLVENIGDGSEFAAPMFRRLVEAYVVTNPSYRYPWEGRIGEFNEEYFNPPPEEEEEPQASAGGP